MTDVIVLIIIKFDISIMQTNDKIKHSRITII